MFLRPYRVAKGGKDHTYWSLVETVRRTDGPRQRTVCYLGELNYSTQSRWLKAIEVFNEQGGRRQLKLFPSQVKPPANDPDVARVWVKKIRLERVRWFGDCFLGFKPWKRLELDRFFEALLHAEPGDVPWSRVAALWAINRLCGPSSELGIEERWYPATALDDLLGIQGGAINDTRLYRCLDRLLPHKTKLEQHLKQRCGELFAAEFKDWPAMINASKQAILEAGGPAEFERRMHDLVRGLGTSHTGFFHQSVNRVPGRLAVSATFRKAETPDGSRWMFQDVHEGGPAYRAGIAPLDILLSTHGRSIIPPEQPTFPMGATAAVTIRKKDQTEATVNIRIPSPRTRKQPYAEPRAVSFRKLDGNIGYLKATIFPGLLGIDVARELDAAFAGLSDSDRLIVDLRGNLGGGFGVLRLMSHLTPRRIPIGYSVTRKRAEHGFNRESLRRFSWIPSSKLAIPLVALRHAGRDGSVVLMTEGFGPKKCHGRIVLLVNQHTASAGEMITAFAAEIRLATIVGTDTAGRLLGGSGFKVGHGYLVIIPKAAFYTWQDKSYEGHGIPPDVPVAWSPEVARVGKDSQLEKAVQVVGAL